MQGGSALGKGHELAAPGRAHAAGGILRKIPHAHFPHGPLAGRDHRPHIPRPGVRVRAGKVHDHAAGAVHTRRPGVGVAGLAGGAVHGDGKGVVTAVLVAGQVDAPHALRPALQRQGAHAGAAVAFAVEVHRHTLGRGGPQVQPCAGGRILRPQRAGIGGLAGKGVALEQRFQFSRVCGVHVPSFLLANFP